MSWKEELEQAKTKDRTYTIHVSLPGKTDVYLWLKQQSAEHKVPLARIAAMILSDAMEKEKAQTQKTSW